MPDGRSKVAGAARPEAKAKRLEATSTSFSKALVAAFLLLFLAGGVGAWWWLSHEEPSRWAERERMEAEAERSEGHAGSATTRRVVDRGAPQAPAHSGGLIVRTEPAGAVITIDGQEEMSPALLRELPAGNYQMHLDLSGYEMQVVEVEVVAGRVEEMTLIALKRNIGNLLLVTEPRNLAFRLESRFEESGEKVLRQGSTPSYLEGLPTGSYSWIIHLEDGLKVNRPVNVSLGIYEEVELDLRPGERIASLLTAFNLKRSVELTTNEH